MNKPIDPISQNPLYSKSLVIAFALLASTALVNCGVKGKPLPPLEPAEIGRGAPTYKRAAEQAKPVTVPASPNVIKPSASPAPERHGP